MTSISLIIPTYNEARNLSVLCKEIFDSLQEGVDVELIVVDDNSPDGTGRVADDLARTYPIKVIHRAGKLGLGSAVREGFKLSTRPYVGVMDADLSHDPAILKQMVSLLDEHDIVIGSRFQPGSSVERWPWYRKLMSKVGVAVARRLTGVSDPLSGYFFLRREVIDGANLTTTGYKILFEILVKGRYQKIKEISYQFRIRQYSASKLNVKEYWLFLKQVVEYWSERRLKD